VGQKVSIAIGLAAVVAVGVGLLGMSALGSTDRAAQDTYQRNVLGLVDSGAVARAVVEMRLYTTNQALSADEAEIASYEEKITEAGRRVQGALDDYRSRATDPARVEQLDTFEAALAAYDAIRDDKLLPAGRDGDLDAWRDARDEAGQSITDMMGAIDALAALETEDAKANAVRSHELYGSNLTSVLVLLVGGLVGALVVGFLVSRGLLRGIGAVHRVADRLAEGDLTCSANLRGGDELGRMGRALDVAVVRMHDVCESVGRTSSTLAGAAEEMSGTTTQIAAGAEQTAAQAGVVTTVAEEVSRNVATVASGTEQMGASIREIASSAAEAARVAQNAVGAARSTSASVGRLGESSKQIGDVVRVISQIAEQTNLLALNATIEAARAGEAGKGFAVVAGEVKDLARATAEATRDIAQRVEAIQSDSSDAVSAIEEISGIIDTINGYQATIASAVEEQTATTGEIARSVSQAAGGSATIAANIADVAGAATQTTQGVAQSQVAIEELARMASDLHTLAGGFRY
jgi:methyl-accepting chemotaxis protein